MPYLGNAPSATFQSVAYQDLTGGTGTSFTLSHAVSSAQELEVFVNNVRQEPTVAYSAVGTTLTMTGTIAATDDFYVVFQGKAVGSVSHPTTSPLAATTGTFSGNVTSSGTVTASSFSGDGSALTGVSAGAGGTPGLVHLSTQTLASDATEVVFNSLIDTSTYTNYKIHAQGHTSADANVRAVFRDSSDADINTSSLYRGRADRSGTVTNDSYMTLFAGSNGFDGSDETGFILDINLNLINQGSTNSIMPQLQGITQFVQNNSNPLVQHVGYIMRPSISTTAVAGIRFYPVSGNFEAGSKFVLYGLAES